MKKTNVFTSLTFSLAACAAIALASAAHAETIPQAITVLKVDGKARYSADNKNWKAVKVGDVIKPGSVIQTADNSTVDLSLGDKEISSAPASHTSASSTANSSQFSAGEGASPKGNVIHIYPSSVLAIDKLNVDRTGTDETADTQLDLRAGKILGNVKKLSSSSRYEVKIPNGVAGIRGTLYVVSSTGQVYVVQGEVIISYVTPSGTVVTKTVSAGQEFSPTDSTGSQNPTVSTIPPQLLAVLQATAPAVGTTGPSTLPATPANPVIHVSPVN